MNILGLQNARKSIQKDFGPCIDVIPVSDPNIPSNATYDVDTNGSTGSITITT